MVVNVLTQSVGVSTAVIPCKSNWYGADCDGPVLRTVLKALTLTGSGLRAVKVSKHFVILIDNLASAWVHALLFLVTFFYCAMKNKQCFAEWSHRFNDRIAHRYNPSMQCVTSLGQLFMNLSFMLFNHTVWIAKMNIPTTTISKNLTTSYAHELDCVVNFSCTTSTQLWVKNCSVSAQLYCLQLCGLNFLQDLMSCKLLLALLLSVLSSNMLLKWKGTGVQIFWVEILSLVLFS